MKEGKDMLDEILGVLGGALASPYPQAPYEALQVRGAMEARQQYIPQCIHSNCPICIEKATKQREIIQAEAEIAQDKKIVYKMRCAVYMARFRAKYKFERSL